MTENLDRVLCWELLGAAGDLLRERVAGGGGAEDSPVCSQGTEVCRPGEAGEGCWSHSGEELRVAKEDRSRWAGCVGGRSVAAECTMRNRSIQVSWLGHLRGRAWYLLMLFKCPSPMLSQDALVASRFHKDYIGHPGKGFISHFAYI